MSLLLILNQDQALNPGEQYIVHAQVYADGSYPTYCKNCFIQLALQNPQDGDYIAQNSNSTNDEGRIYAKVISKVSGNRTLYVHLSQVYVSDEQGKNRIAKGQPIGKMGSTGRSTGTHLHFEVQKNGVAINPLDFLR